MFQKKEVSEELLGLKKKPKKTFFILLCLMSLFFGGLLISLAYLVFYSPYLKVQKIETRGNKTITSELFLTKIRLSMAAKNNLFNILGPENILFWKFSKKPFLFSTILPAVSGLTINVDVLKRTVDFDLTERKPIGIWCGENGDCYSFDESGVIFAKAPAIQGVLILKVDDLSSAPIVLGRSVLPQKDWFRGLLGTLNIVRDAGFNIVSITVKETELREWEILTSTGIRLAFSFNFVPEDLGRVLAALKGRFASGKATVLDFRVPQRVYYK